MTRGRQQWDMEPLGVSLIIKAAFDGGQEMAKTPHMQQL